MNTIHRKIDMFRENCRMEGRKEIENYMRNRVEIRIREDFEKFKEDQTLTKGIK
jgi:hypothetical protein